MGGICVPTPEMRGGGGVGGDRGPMRMLDGGHIVFGTNPISIGIMQVISL